MPIENTTSPKGKSGTLVQAGVVGDEYISALSGREAAAVYSKMEKSDYQVIKVLSAIQNPILATQPTIEPVSTEPADVQAAALMEQILLKDLDFAQVLGEILTFIPRGYSVHEVVTMNRDDKLLGPYTGLAQLGFRDQSSLDKWLYDKNTGNLLAIEQKQGGDIEVDVELDAKFLLIFYNRKKGDDNGFPMLRPLYGPYKRKLLIEELKMIGIERSAIPTPMMKVPSTVDNKSEEYAIAEELLGSFTSGENAYIMVPQGWDLTLTANVFDPTKLESTIKSEDEKMAGSVLAMFVELGTGGNSGALALSENLEKFFTNGIQSYASTVETVINKNLIPFLCALNYGDALTQFPKLKLSGLGTSAGTALMTIITGFTNAQVITKDVILEDYIRNIYKLPKRAEGTVTENGSAPEDGGTPTEGGEDPNAADAATPTEAAAPKLKDVHETLKFAERPSKSISNASEEVATVIRERLTMIKEKMLKDVMYYYKSKPDNKKVTAIKHVTPGGTRKLKDEMKSVLSRIAFDSIKKARLEVPGSEKIKLKDNQIILKALDADGSFKFDDYSKLPKHLQVLLGMQTEVLGDKLVNDLSDRVAFTFMQSTISTDSADIIAQDIAEAADAIISAGAIDTAATNVTSTIVNESRNSLFFDDEVLEMISSFTFMNADPISAICTSLAGMTFAVNDAEALRYSPPLHHNCKSYLSPNLKTSRTQKEITGLPPISEAAKKSITLSEKVDNYRLKIENIYKGCTHA